MYKKIYEHDVSLHSGIPKVYSHLKHKKFGEWEIPPWEVYIDSNKLLGEGSWAKVYLAEWRQTTVVAKVLKNSFDTHAKELIIKEFENMTKMHHPNIVQLFGYVEEPFVIIMEYFQNGDLFQNLNNLKLNQKIKIASDIIKGLIYIHERRPNSLIHRDIKPRNILLTNSYSAKIADFGLSTFSIGNIIKIASNNNLVLLENQENTYETSNYIESNEYTDNVGTERYMAPEVKTKYYNNKVDIYSCGILLYELFSGSIYLGEFHWDNSNISHKLKELILKMVNNKPEDRPNASSTLYYFNQIKFNNYKHLLHDLKSFTRN
jgi:serine/threonine protein kinase